MTRLLGIDIGEREIRVAHAERTFGTLRLTALDRLPLDDRAALVRLLALRPQAVLTALPAAFTTHRILVLPFRDRRRLESTVPLELLGQLPVEPDDADVAFVRLGPTDGGTAVLAAVARRAQLSEYAAPLAAAGLPPTRIDLAPLPIWNLLPPEPADLTLLIADGARSALSVRRAGRLAGLRALGARATDRAALAAEVRWSLHALGDAGPALVLAGADADPELAAALEAATGARVIPLADAVAFSAPAGAADLAACAVAAGLAAGAGRRARVGLAFSGVGAAPSRSLRRAAALALVASAFGAVDVGLVRHGLARRDANLARAIVNEAEAALPGTRLVAPRAQLEVAVATAARRQQRLGRPSSVLQVLRELSSRIPPTLQLDLDELSVERDALLLHGRCESFDGVDSLRRALGASPLLADVTAEETRATVDGRRVEFRLHATRRPAPGASS